MFRDGIKSKTARPKNLYTYVPDSWDLGIQFSGQTLKSNTNKLPLNGVFRAETLESGVFRGTLGDPPTVTTVRSTNALYSGCKIRSITHWTLQKW